MNEKGTMVFVLDLKMILVLRVYIVLLMVSGRLFISMRSGLLCICVLAKRGQIRAISESYFLSLTRIIDARPSSRQARIFSRF